MEKLAMCRICLVKNVRMYVVVNKTMHELYEKLTNVPFVTEDRRPTLACYFCCTKLKQCYRFMRNCLEAEELFSQMLNEGNKQDFLINPGHFFNGFSNSPIELISIIDDGQTESEAIKEEVPDVSERLEDIVYPGEEHQTSKSELYNVDNSYRGSEYKVHLTEIKIEVEDQERSIGTFDEKKPKLETQRPNPKETISAKPKTNENNAKTSSVHSALGAVSRNHSDVDAIKCQISKKGVDSDVHDRNTHRRVCVTEKRFDCAVCQRSFNKNSDLIRHARVHTGEKPYKCDVCQRSFKLKYHLTIHTRIHTGEKPHKCEICQRSFRHKNYLKSHTRTHTGEKPFKCDICTSSFNQKIHLTTHIRTHTGEKPYKCDTCQRSFTKKGDLVSHTRTHTGEKPFKCDICQRSFNKKIDFVSHTRTHAGEKPFKCEICQLSFTKKCEFLSHNRTHTVEKSLRCVICQLNFTYKSDLVRHILTHQEKPFNCDMIITT